jgi:hypothetical protein
VTNIYPNLDMSDEAREELRYQWERLPDMCPQCGAIVGPCRVDVEKNLAFYGCCWHGGPDPDGKFRWGPVAWPDVRLWKARNIKVVERFVDPEPVAKTTKEQPVFDAGRAKPPATLGPGEYLNDRGMRARDGRLVCQFCGKTTKFGWTYGNFGEVALATCGRCRPPAPWTESVEFHTPRRSSS